jgi:hypothetical protein
MPLATESTLNEITGISSVPAADAAGKDGQGDDRGKGAELNPDGTPKSSDGTLNTDGHEDAGAEDAAGKKTDGRDEGDGADDGKAKPYHKDPDFQRMKKERDDARSKFVNVEKDLSELRGQFTALMELVKSGKTGGGAGDGDDNLPFKDVTKMSDDEITEWQTTDPKGFAANSMAQIRYEIENGLKAKDEIKAKQTAQSASKATYEKYANDNPDFETMWNDGTIKDFMEKNPGHNPLSAHMALTRQDRINKAIEKTIAEKTKQIEKDIRAKFKAGTLAGGNTFVPQHKESDIAPELRNTKAHGGLISGIVNHLKQMRAASGT